MEKTTQRIVISSMLAALCCVATMIIRIPSPMKGYLNLGDSIVLLAGFIISPLYGFFAAAIGSALADVLSGYAFYAPATFVIKGLMAIVAFYGFKILHKKIGKTPSRIIAGVVAEVIMVLGYFIFEVFFYGFALSLINIPANLVQGVVGIIVGISLTGIFERAKIPFDN